MKRREFLTGSVLAGFLGLFMLPDWAMKWWTRTPSMREKAQAAVDALPRSTSAWVFDRTHWYREIGTEPRDVEGYLHMQNYFVPLPVLLEYDDVNVDPHGVWRSEEAIMKFAGRMHRYMPEGSTIIGLCRPSNMDGILLSVQHPKFEKLYPGYICRQETMSELSVGAHKHLALWHTTKVA